MLKITIDEFILLKKQAEGTIEQVVSDLYERTGYMIQHIEIDAPIGVKKAFVTGCKREVFSEEVKKRQPRNARKDTKKRKRIL